ADTDELATPHMSSSLSIGTKLIDHVSNPRRWQLPVIASVIASALATGCDQSSGPSPSPARGIGLINHIVFVVKENRTFDNYFGTCRGADGAQYGPVSTGAMVRLGHTPDRPPHDIDHTYLAAITAIHGGSMDRFDLIQGGNDKGELLAYTQLTESDIP